MMHRAKATPAATRQEILDGFVDCLDAKEDAAVIQASEELGELGAVAAGAALKLAKGGLTSPTRYSAEAAVVALSKFHRAEVTPSATRQEILDGLVACLQAKERAPVFQASAELGARSAAAVAAVP